MDNNSVWNDKKGEHVCSSFANELSFLLSSCRVAIGRLD